MLAGPPLLVLLLLSLVSAFSTLMLLLLPLLARFSPWKLLNPSRPLPRSFYPSLPPRPKPRPSARALAARKVAVVLAAVDLGVLVLALWQGLLFWLRSSTGPAPAEVHDDIGQGVRMGLALVGRQVIWCAVLVYLHLQSRLPDSAVSLATADRKMALAAFGAATAVIVLFAGLFAGVAAVDLRAVYGVALAGGSSLMLGATALAGTMLYAAVKDHEEREVCVVQEGRGEKVPGAHGRGEGWGEGESWISSPSQTVQSLPPFDLSLNPKSQHARLLRSTTPGLTFGDGASSRRNSWLTSPSRSVSPLPEWFFSNAAGSSEGEHIYPSASDDKTPNSWLTEPEGTQPTLSPFSFPSSSGGADVSRPYSRSPTPEGTGQDSAYSFAVVPILGAHQQSGPPSPLAVGPDPFAGAEIPEGRGVSSYTVASSYSGTPLSPPPRVPLPPLPPPASAVAPVSEVRSSSDVRPSTSSRWTTTSGSRTHSHPPTEATRPSTSEWTPTTLSTFADVHYLASRAPETATGTAFSGSALGLSAMGVGDGHEKSSTVELGGRREEVVLRRKGMETRHVALFVAMIICAWIVSALSLPAIIDALSHKTIPASSAETVTLAVSFTLSSHFALLFTFLLRTNPFKSVLDVPSSEVQCSATHPARPSTTASTRPSTTLYGSAQPHIVVQASAPAKPSLTGEKDDKRRSRALRPLTLVAALADERSNSSMSTNSEQRLMQGRCMSPNEEGNLADVWHANGHVSRPVSRLSRVLSMLSPNPTLQQLPVPGFSAEVSRAASVSNRAPTSRSPSLALFRAPSPSPSVASSRASHVTASVQGEETMTHAAAADRTHSRLGSVHWATVSTAQRGTRVSGDLARIVYVPSSPAIGEFGATPGGSAQKAGETKGSAYSIDWMTAGLLPRLVPTIRIGKEMNVTSGDCPTSQVGANGTTTFGTTAGKMARSIIRRLSSYDKEELPFQHVPPPEHSHASSPPSSVVRLRAGAQAPTPSHGRSTSIEMRSTSFISHFFDSPSVVASTPMRGAQTARHRSKPSEDYRPKHKTYASLPAINDLEIDETWSAEVLDEFGRLAEGADEDPITLGELDLSLGESFSSTGGKRTFGDSGASYDLPDVDEGEEVDGLPMQASSKSTSSGRSTPHIPAQPSALDDVAGDTPTPSEEPRPQKSTFGPPSTAIADDEHVLTTALLTDAGTHHHIDGMLQSETRPVSQVSSASTDGTDLEYKLAQLQAELATEGAADESINVSVEVHEDDEAVDDGRRLSDDGRRFILPDPVVEAPTPRTGSVSADRIAQIPDMETCSPHSEYHMPLRLHRTASEASALTVASTCSTATDFSVFSYHSPTPLPRAGLANNGRVGPLKSKVKPASAAAPPRTSSSLSFYRPTSSASRYSSAIRPETALSHNSRPASRQDVLKQSWQMNVVAEEQADNLKGSQSSSRRGWSPLHKVGAVYSQRADKASNAAATVKPLR